MQTTPDTILYFRFHYDVGHGIQQVEYNLLQSNLSQHRGYNDSVSQECCDGYWAIAVTAETGLGSDAVEYTTNYLSSIPVIDKSSIATTPPSPDQRIEP